MIAPTPRDHKPRLGHNDTGNGSGQAGRYHLIPGHALAVGATVRHGPCKWCGSVKVVKNGKRNDEQLYRCKDCRHQFFDNGKFPRMRKPKTIVAAALRLYFDGASLPKVGRSLRSLLGTGAHHSTIHDWITKYVPQVDAFLGNFTPDLSGVWHSDETTLRFRPSKHLTGWQRARGIRRPGEDWWQWDAIDEGTRFIVGTSISRTRTYQEGLAFMRGCAQYAPRPTKIVTDSLPTYPRIIRRVFYSVRPEERVKHIHLDSGFKPNQVIERWHGTLEDRVTAMRGLKSPLTPIPRGFAIDYNFLRPHMSLDGLTPAQAAGIQLPFNDGWGNLIAWATVYRTLKELASGRPPAVRMG